MAGRHARVPVGAVVGARDKGMKDNGRPATSERDASATEIKRL